jgi:hypothetical protein
MMSKHVISTWKETRTCSGNKGTETQLTSLRLQLDSSGLGLQNKSPKSMIFHKTHFHTAVRCHYLQIDSFATSFYDAMRMRYV